MGEYIKGNIYPGEIVLAKEFDIFTNTVKLHPFLVWKMNNTNLSTINNCYAFRITSNQCNDNNWWSVQVSPDSENNLSKKSYIVTDSIHLLNAKELKYLGWVTSKIFFEVIKIRQRVQSVEIIQAVKSYGKLKLKEGKSEEEDEL